MRVIAAGEWFGRGLPVPPPPVAGIQSVGKSVLGRPGHRAKLRRAENGDEPRVARGAPQDLQGAICADIRATGSVYAVQAPAHVLDPAPNLASASGSWFMSLNATRRTGRPWQAGSAGSRCRHRRLGFACCTRR